MGDLLIKSNTCIEELERISRLYNAHCEILDWATEDLVALRELNLRIEQEGPSSVDPPGQLWDLIKKADILIVHFCPVSGDLIKSAPCLKLIATLRTGTSNIDKEAAKAGGVDVINLPGRLSDAVSELTIGLIFTATRGIARAHEALRQGKWMNDFTETDWYFELSGRTIGLIGFGDIGRKVAHRLSPFNVKILVFDPFVTTKMIENHDSEKVDLEKLLSESDIVSIHSNLNDSTRGMIGEREFDLMKTSGFLINTSRAEIVQKSALYKALSHKSIAGAAMDVFWQEPADPDDPLLHLDNIVVTPHLGGTLKDTLYKSIFKLNQRLIPYYEKLSNIK
ncbi:MAG: 2-hydroxyacid dehydrogenase [Bacteroidales bacterium]|nr:2-hydroxyacid dehydrogenase [Bacteroidales bacterium]